MCRLPVLVVIDDLHWVDLGSLAALRVIARAASSRPVMVVGAFRDVDLAASAERMAVVAEIEREAMPRRVDLRGLDVDDVGTLLRRMGDTEEVPAEFIELLRTRSSGNPLFIRETLLTIIDEGKISRDETGEWRATEGDIEVPSVIRQVIDRRLQQLSDQARSLLGLGALFETAFPLDVTAEVAGLDEDAALDAIDEALDAQAIAATATFDEYRFSHAMYRDVLADGHSPSRRPRLHRRLAEALEKRLPVVALGVRYRGGHASVPRECGPAGRGARRRVRARSGPGARALGLVRRGGVGLSGALSLLPNGDDRVAETLLDIARVTGLAGRGRATTLAAAEEARAPSTQRRIAGRSGRDRDGGPDLEPCRRRDCLGARRSGSTDARRVDR